MGYIFAIGAAIAWGLVYALDQKILEKVSPFVLMVINSFFTIIVLAPLFFRAKNFKAIANLDKASIKIIGLSLVVGLFANIFIYFAIKNLGSSKAAIFEIAYPFFVILFSVFLFHTSVNAYFLLGSLLLFAGATIIVTLG